MLRRELSQVREQLAAVLVQPCERVDAVHGQHKSHSSTLWLAAQIQQSQRQVAVLSSAMLARSELSAELESILLQMRQPAPYGTRSEAATWAAAAMRRLRHVQFVEGIAPAMGEAASEHYALKNGADKPLATQVARLTSGVAAVGKSTQPSQRKRPT